MVKETRMISDVWAEEAMISAIHHQLISIPSIDHIVTHISNIHLFLALYGQSKVMDPL